MCVIDHTAFERVTQIFFPRARENFGSATEFDKHLIE